MPEKREPWETPERAWIRYDAYMLKVLCYQERPWWWRLLHRAPQRVEHPDGHDA